jgi:hypothetical protein
MYGSLQIYLMDGRCAGPLAESRIRWKRGKAEIGRSQGGAASSPFVALQGHL